MDRTRSRPQVHSARPSTSRASRGVHSQRRGRAPLEHPSAYRQRWSNSHLKVQNFVATAPVHREGCGRFPHSIERGGSRICSDLASRSPKPVRHGSCRWPSEPHFVLTKCPSQRHGPSQREQDGQPDLQRAEGSNSEETIARKLVKWQKNPRKLPRGEGGMVEEISTYATTGTWYSQNLVKSSRRLQAKVISRSATVRLHSSDRRLYFSGSMAAQLS